MGEKRRFVLIVDDDPSMRDTISKALRSKGFESVQAQDGAEAMAYLAGAEEKPGLILLDLRMPVMDGFKFRELQLSYSRLSIIPTVIHSSELDLEKSAKTLKVDEFLRKPFEYSALMKLVEKYC